MFYIILYDTHFVVRFNFFIEFLHFHVMEPVIIDSKPRTA